MAFYFKLGKMLDLIGKAYWPTVNPEIFARI